MGQASTLTEPGTPHSQETAKYHAARDTRSSTRRSRRQAAIGSVIVTLNTLCPCRRCSANWTA